MLFEVLKNVFTTLFLGIVGIALLAAFMVPHGKHVTGVPTTPTITLRQFNGLANGMSYDDVAEALGSPGLTVTPDTADDAQAMDRAHVVMKVWSNAGGKSVGYMTVAFKNGKLVQKVQFGLREGP